MQQLYLQSLYAQEALLCGSAVQYRSQLTLVTCKCENSELSLSSDTLICTLNRLHSWNPARSTSSQSSQITSTSKNQPLLLTSCVTHLMKLSNQSFMLTSNCG